MAAGSSHLCGSVTINNAELCGRAGTSFLYKATVLRGWNIDPPRHLAFTRLQYRLDLENQGPVQERL
ncbi:Hypothetical predicted protein [Marmota monax]|uniref:Uncharacterized protein n=1 Tax=Marmota monax TaxID=9995 RepID=A0A5E4AQ65_MARMO|nr:hypothetical protein GHT09_002665 [Marmota monax]VTJ58632.1 Hypothetical predicted protein [Marmota monax]